MESSTKVQITWEGVVNVGFTVVNDLQDKWKSASGFQYNDGYMCTRKIFNNEHFYILTCSICSSNLQRPIFKCEVKNQSGEVESFSSTNPTDVMKKTFNYTQLFPKRTWNGNYFFGLHRSDVKNLLKRAEIKNVSESATNTLKEANRFKTVSWGGVQSVGKVTDNKNFVCKVGREQLILPDGYLSVRFITVNGTIIKVQSKINSKDGLPIFQCFSDDPKFNIESFKISEVVRLLFAHLKVKQARRWSGHDFFGLTRSDVVQQINFMKIRKDTEESSNKKKITENDIMKSVVNVRHRNAGPTSSLCSKAQRNRNEMIHELINFATFGDVRGYINFLCENYMDVLDDALENSESYTKHFINTMKLSTQPIELGNHETAEMLVGKCDLSQRGYKNLRQILLKNNVKIPSYDIVRKYIKNLNVGEINNIHGDDSSCNCMGVKTTMSETLQKIVSSPKLFSKFKFPEKEANEKIVKYLKKKDSLLYTNLKEDKRTIFIRATGDNFRASAKMPTEQTSYSILNMLEFTNSPYGQFISTLWRGSESREMIDSHITFHFNELTNLVKSGIVLKLNENSSEEFNIVCFMVADLCFLKDVIGQCQCTSLYGCYHCKLKNVEWISKSQKIGEPKSLEEMTRNGIKALKILGNNPVRDSPLFKNVQQNHYGQWTTNLFVGCIIELMPPCGLHMILANHRYLWKFLYDIVNKREMDSLIPSALRKIGCGYLAYQLEQYHKSKKKCYDGSSTLKMIGNDCKMIESNIDVFLDTFISKDKGETWESPSSAKLRQLLQLYKLFADLARDIRAVEVNKERINSFKTRAENYFQKFLVNCSSSSLNRLPYLHYIRNHTGDLMVLHMELFGWGYGVYCCHAGEHLNKLIKTYEITETNLDMARFETITHLFRVKQLIFTDSITPKKVTVTCSACGVIGHNKKNKSCILHPSHPVIEFEESDNDI